MRRIDAALVMKRRMKKILCFTLIGIASLALGTGGVNTAFAQISRGWINENVSYEDLEVKRGTVNSSRHGRVRSCVFSGKIVSTSTEQRKNVTITFYAINVFNETMWESVVHIESLPPLASHEFRNKISCEDKDPYRWEIKVVESPWEIEQ